MDGSYSITAFPARCLLEITMGGLFDPASAKQLALEPDS